MSSESDWQPLLGRILVLFLFSFILSAYSDPFWWPCEGTVHYHIESVNVNPWPILINSNVTTTVAGVLDMPVTAGVINFTIAMLQGTRWVPLPTSPYIWDLCTITKCPIVPGPKKYTEVITVPFFAPPGTYHGDLRILDKSGKVIGCVNWQAALVPHSLSVAITP